MADSLDSLPDPNSLDIRQSSRKKGVAGRIRKLKLRHPELTASEIAKTVGCSPNNVYGVLQTFLGERSSDDLREYQDNQADVFDALSLRFLGSVTPEKLLNSKPMEAVTAAAILFDKARLVRGQATGINVSVLMDVVDAMRLRATQAPQPLAIRDASASE